MFQPVGGMDAIGPRVCQRGWRSDPIRLQSYRIEQDDNGVTVTYQDTKAPANTHMARAAWWICTIPLSILSQIPIGTGGRMKAAIDAVPYAPAVKIGLQFKRRFWEEDEAIYGEISYTDLPIQQIAYPNADLNRNGPGVLLGAYVVGGANSFEFTSLHRAERIARALELGSIIHPQYPAEFENGISVAWHRVRSLWEVPVIGPKRPDRSTTTIFARSTAGSAGWGARVLHSCVQEGAILSALDAIERLHLRVTKA